MNEYRLARFYGSRCIVTDFCLDVHMSSNFISNRYSCYSFSQILTKIATFVPWANTENAVEVIFEILLKKFLANFSNFELRLSLWNSLNDLMSQN